MYGILVVGDSFGWYSGWKGEDGVYKGDGDG